MLRSDSEVRSRTPQGRREITVVTRFWAKSVSRSGWFLPKSVSRSGWCPTLPPVDAVLDFLGMPLPPWSLISNNGVYHYVRDEAALRVLAEEQDLVLEKCSTNLLRRLVDPRNKKALDKLPQHQKQWQLLEKVKWLQRVDDETVVVPIVGNAKHFVTHFAKSRVEGDMLDLGEERLGEFLTDGTIRRDSTRVDTLATRGSKYRWRLLEHAPSDANQFFPHVAPGYPTAPPAGSCRRLKCPFCLVAAAPTMARDNNVRAAIAPAPAAPAARAHRPTHLPTHPHLLILTRHSVRGRWVDRLR